MLHSAAHHPTLITNNHGDISSDYSEMNIIRRMENWVVIGTWDLWDLFSYSVQQNICSSHAWAPYQAYLLGDLFNMDLK